MVKKILENDFDVDFQYRSQTALQLAVREGCFNICKLLIDKGANVNMSDAEQNSLLNTAAWRGMELAYHIIWTRQPDNIAVHVKILLHVLNFTLSNFWIHLVFWH